MASEDKQDHKSIHTICKFREVGKDEKERIFDEFVSFMNFGPSPDEEAKCQSLTHLYRVSSYLQSNGT